MSVYLEEKHIILSFTDEFYSWILFINWNSLSFDQKGVLRVAWISYSKVSYYNYILYIAQEGNSSKGYISKINPQTFYTEIN